jgi:integrase
VKKDFNFTKTDILKLTPPPSGTETYRDTKEKGLSLYITAKGVLTFFVRKRINGRDERVILGAFPDLSVEQARKAALKVKSDVAQGRDPNEHKNALRQEMTFGQMFQEYMERYSKKHKKSWIYDEREVNRFLSHWFKRKLSSITKQEVQHIQEKIHDDNGLYQANRILERIRAIYNKAIEWGWKGSNPTQGIKKYKEKSRDRFVATQEFPALFEALDAEENETVRDFVLMALLTGARRANVLAMRWDQIDWASCQWRIPETKNGEPVTIPLIERAMTLLEGRRQQTNSEWVFPSAESASGHLADPKRAWARICKRAGITNLRIHDIRRTLGSYQAITGASLQVIGKSLGHKSQQATAIYSRLNLDPVRESVERAADAMMLAGKRS